jgi:hypothetical protein
MPVGRVKKRSGCLVVLPFHTRDKTTSSLLVCVTGLPMCDKRSWYKPAWSYLATHPAGYRIARSSHLGYPVRAGCGLLIDLGDCSYRVLFTSLEKHPKVKVAISFSRQDYL